MRYILIILFICTICANTLHAQVKSNKESHPTASITKPVPIVKNIQIQPVNAYRDSLNLKKNLNKLVDMGYGLIKAKNITGSISTVDTSPLQTEGYSNIFDFLQGRVAGLTVTPDPSNASGYTIRIRGINTLIGSSDPLVVIDGTPLNGLDALMTINPSDVKAISVLKGPSAAIYGTRGGNGVILITTK